MLGVHLVISLHLVLGHYMADLRLVLSKTNGIGATKYNI